MQTDLTEVRQLYYPAVFVIASIFCMSHLYN